MAVRDCQSKYLFYALTKAGKASLLTIYEKNVVSRNTRGARCGAFSLMEMPE